MSQKAQIVNMLVSNDRIIQFQLKSDILIVVHFTNSRSFYLMFYRKEMSLNIARNNSQNIT